MPEGVRLTSDNHEDFLGHLKMQIRQAQIKAALAVNRELIIALLAE